MAIEYNLAANTAGHIIDSPGSCGCVKNSNYTCMMAWLYPYTFEDVNGEGYIYDIVLASFSAYRFGVRKITAATGYLFFASRPRAGDAYNNIVGTTVLNQNTWYHLAIMADWAAAKAYMYVNGVLEYAPVAQGGWGTPTENNFPRYECVGQFADASGGSAANVINGKIDDVRIYNRQLTADQILTIYTCKGSDKIMQGCQHRLLMTAGVYDSNAVGAGILKDYGAQKQTYTEKYPLFPASQKWKDSYIKLSEINGN